MRHLWSRASVHTHIMPPAFEVATCMPLTCNMVLWAHNMIAMSMSVTTDSVQGGSMRSRVVECGEVYVEFH